MANRFPLIFNSGAGQIQELAASDNLDLTSSNLVNAGILSTSSGSATAPSLQIGSGTTYNPGLYSPGTDQLAISTNGTGRLFVDANGNIGVGTSSPANFAGFVTLALADSSGAEVDFIKGSTVQGLVYNAGDIFYIESKSTVPTVFVTNGSERMRLTSAGLLGLGTASPGALLDVAAGIRANSAGSVTSGFSNGVNIGTWDALGYDSNDIVLGGYRASQFTGLRFYTAATERARIDSSGRLGLGTTTPLGLLDLGAADSATALAIANWRAASYNGSILQWGGITASQWSTAAFFTGGTERARITSAGLVGIGTTNPSSKLHVAGGGSGSRGALRFSDDGGSNYWEIGRDNTSTGDFTFNLNSSEKARIDISGRLLVGTSTNNPTFDSRMQVAGSGGGATILLDAYSANSNGPVLYFGKSRSATVGTHTIVQNDDLLGALDFYGSSNTGPVNAATIKAVSDGGTPSATSMPGRLVFSTTPDGLSSPTERMRISSGGAVGIGKTPDFNPATNGFEVDSGACIITRAGGAPLFINRNTDDGTLVSFRQAATEEGTISVSGTTVSYNGAHLSRWSQLPSGTERTEILRGSVLSNLDEMCGWGDEDNEQLNRMKVSDVEGDKNVSGVFQCWDDDDDTYTDDFYCAMTGDFIIRIAEGVTVERGDLLMSAGDGTAKPQDDDIIRSKTIAKVTSTHVTCTYEDGSYCVPCVLMAC